MEIAPLSPRHFETYLAMANAAIQPAGAATSIQDDRPLLLSFSNLANCFGIVAEDHLVGGIACLVRQFETSCGRIPVAAIGAVVTHPEHRGRGLSRRLQEYLLDRLDMQDVPLAVLWTDQPWVYAGRGFRSAGWEIHFDFEPAELPATAPHGFTIRNFDPQDTRAVAALYAGHRLRTVRLPDDAEKLYGMMGTRGLVAAGADGVAAAAIFCGKGGDFPAYVTEWDGPLGLVLPLLAQARRLGWAQRILVPAGSDHLVDRLLALGAQGDVREGGMWAVVQPDKLSRYLQGAGHGAPADVGSPTAWLGSVTADGRVKLGALTVAVWGFDSV